MRGGLWPTSITVGGALAVATIALVIRRVAEDEWKFAEALVDGAQVLVTGGLVVIALEWYGKRRWRDADRQALQSLALTIHLAASGWSNPKNVARPDLRPQQLTADLESHRTMLRDKAKQFEEVFRRIPENDTSAADVEHYPSLRTGGLSLRAYHAEGSRRRRLAYLRHLADAELERLVARRDDPTLAQCVALLRDRIASALASADHAEVVVRSMIGRSPPNEWAARAALLDPVEALAEAIERLPELVVPTSVLRHCVGAVRNELQWVAETLDVMAGIVQHLAGDLEDANRRLAPANDGR